MLGHINESLLDQLLDRSECCTLSNAASIKRGLKRLNKWASAQKDMGSPSNQLGQIQQVRDCFKSA